jgi:hypothetical protein
MTPPWVSAGQLCLAELVIPDRQEPAADISSLIAMLELLWRGQTDRHGGVGPTPTDPVGSWSRRRASRSDKGSRLRPHRGELSEINVPSPSITTSCEPMMPSWSISAWCIGTARSLEPATTSV